ncbi:pimeloyl-ACP methyl ester carboxylesterase [Sphingomonas jejuensis]|uniref:Palmitoyl-protein thioesterase ABHD10, mitochondrial n=1 Tax=Sphingomonas jejuensis TaxID=904715 RepID=A0ABX0XP87_9SPHN|nr:alpha/beta hydrolase [Sphingomonas jejuensis]NJC35059.1 pimeloyl-ACP methyl ester carboxylesterase [Sphingomonas jejuensis]
MGDLIRLDVRPGTSIAVRHRAGIGPTLLFLPGYLSDMAGSKAVAVDRWCAERGRACVRFDYSGCGESGGDVSRATLAHWRDEVLALIDWIDGPVLIVGSSMGGWIMLLAALARPDRVCGLIGIAAAPDFTDWGFTPAQKDEIRARGFVEEPNPYGPEPTVTTRAFWESGEANRLLHGQVAIDCPVRLLHGTADPDVPWQLSPRLSDALRSADVQTILIKDGDHRLSRPEDIGLLLGTIEAMLESA